MEQLNFQYHVLERIRKDKMGIVKTVPYKGKFKFLNEFFVPGNKEFEKTVDKATNLKMKRRNK